VDYKKPESGRRYWKQNLGLPKMNLKTNLLAFWRIKDFPNNPGISLRTHPMPHG
jgi:hypothetical protein